MQLWLALSSLCSSDWSQAHNDPAASASQVLELQVCTITPGNAYDISSGHGN